MQPAPNPPSNLPRLDALDSSERNEVVAKLGDALRNNYVFPDIGDKAAEKISASLTAGAYDSFTDTASFAARLSADVSSVSHDKHLRIICMSAPPPSAPGAAVGMPRSEAGVVRGDKLAGGVGKGAALN